MSQMPVFCTLYFFDVNPIALIHPGGEPVPRFRFGCWRLKLSPRQQAPAKHGHAHNASTCASPGVTFQAEKGGGKEGKKFYSVIC